MHGSTPGEPVHASQSFFNIAGPPYLRPGDSQLLTGGPGGGQRVGGTGRGGMAAVADCDRLCPGGAEHLDDPVQFRGGMGLRRPAGSRVAGKRRLGYPR